MRRLVGTLVLLAMLRAVPALSDCPPGSGNPPGVPSAGNSTLPNGVRLVATNAAGVPDPLGTFSVTLRDGCADVIAGRRVRVDISEYTDLAFSTNQAAGVVVDCGLKTATFTTNGSGVATASLVGQVVDFASGGPASARIFAENLAGQSPAWVELGARQVAAYDLNGVNGLTSDDVANFICDFQNFSGGSRADYDFSGSVSAIDLSFLRSAIQAGAGTHSGTRCDAEPNSIPVVAAVGTAFNIRWEDCSTLLPSPLKTFACATNSGTETAIISASSTSPPASFQAVEIEVEVLTAAGGQMPNWWRLDAAGCRTNSVNVTSSPCLTTIPEVLVSTSSVEYPAGSQNRAVIRLWVEFSSPMELPAGVDTPLVAMTISHQKTTGLNSCAGCSAPAQLSVRSMRFVHEVCVSSGQVPSEITYTPDYSNAIFFQAVPPGAVQASKVTPPTTGPSPKRVFTILGTHLEAGTTVLLRRTAQSDIPGTVQSVTQFGTALTAEFDLSSAALGAWDVVLTNPDLSTVTIAGGITVESVEPAVAVASLNGTLLRRPGWTVTQYANFTTTGNVHYDGNAWFAFYVPLGIPSVTAKFAGQSLGTFTPVAMGSRAWVGVFSVPARPELLAGYEFSFIAPAVGAYQSELELFQVQGPISVPAPADARGLAAADLIRSQAIAQGLVWPAFSGGFAAALASALDDALGVRIEAFSAPGSPVIAHADQSELLEAAVEDALVALAGGFGADVTAYRTIWDPLRTTPADWDMFRRGLAATGAALASPPRPVSGYPSPPTTFALLVSNSVDPNDKSGPGGVGVAHDIPAGTPLHYLIHFENMPTATGSAQLVTVDDDLDGSLVDLASLSLGTITLGTRVITVPPGLQSHTVDVDLRPGEDIIARVTASLDAGTGHLSWRFRALDPANLLPTQDAMAGLLPPNVTAPEGEGSVSFTVMPRASNPDGSLYTNFARIVFDDNSYIDTPVWSNRLDDSSPTSNVAALSASQTSLTFPVQWSGADAYSGVLDYSVYVSTDGGPPVLWQDRTTATSALYTGVAGSSHAFYSIARDRVGHVEAAPGVPDAVTTLTLGTGPEALPQRLGFRMLNAGQTFRMELSLPRAGGARLEALDISGRVVSNPDVSQLPAGRHTIELRDFAELPPGLYLVRARQADETVTRKVVHLR